MCDIVIVVMRINNSIDNKYILPVSNPPSRSLHICTIRKKNKNNNWHSSQGAYWSIPANFCRMENWVSIYSQGRDWWPQGVAVRGSTSALQEIHSGTHTHRVRERDSIQAIFCFGLRMNHGENQTHFSTSRYAKHLFMLISCTRTHAYTIHITLI